MRTTKRIFSKKAVVAAFILSAVTILLTATPAFATDAMKPGEGRGGQGHGDANHTHWGAPGQHRPSP